MQRFDVLNYGFIWDSWTQGRCRWKAPRAKRRSPPGPQIMLQSFGSLSFSFSCVLQASVAVCRVSALTAAGPIRLFARIRFRYPQNRNFEASSRRFHFGTRLAARWGSCAGRLALLTSAIVGTARGFEATMIF